MQPELFSFQELLKQLVADMARSLSVREGEPVARRQARVQLVVRMIMAFLPRDVIEATLAGRCVMFHELTVDSARLTLAGEIAAQRRATRANIVALDRCFANNLKLLEHYRTRPSDGEVAIRKVADHDTDAAGATEMAAATQQVAATPGATTASPPEALDPIEPTAPTRDGDLGGSLADYVPSPEAIEAVLSNPAAVAAMEAGDAAAFARALGIEPCAEFLAAAAEPGNPFDPTVWGGGPAEAATDAVPGMAAQPKPERARTCCDLQTVGPMST